MDVVFASVVEQLPDELKEALKSSGIDDPGVLRFHPRSSAEENARKDLGLHVLATSSTVFFLSFFPSCLTCFFFPTIYGTRVAPAPDFKRDFASSLAAGIFRLPRGPGSTTFSRRSHESGATSC